MIKGWTGKRLRIDLSLQKAWSEDIPLRDLHQWLGGRGLNASFFSQHFQSPVSPSSPENPVAFAAGPLTGTLPPCSGWASIASFSPLSDPSGYGFTRMPGHFGASLKGAGFDQCILQGKADRPVYLWIDDGEVKFEEAGHLWRKETTETTIAIQEEKGDRGIEVLCIGPAGERQLPFANIIHRLSWTGDHLGLGYLFGVKQLKAIAIRGRRPVTLHDPRGFLNLCLTLKDRIQKDRKMERLKEEGTLSFLSREGGMIIKNSNRWHPSESEKQWATSLRTYLSGRDGCFSCPVHCGWNIQHQESYFGGIHLEKAWHLGPQIGVDKGEWTEIRLAGALTGSLGAQLLLRMGNLPGFETLLPWTSFFLSILFLISTGWAYRFHTHPAWKTNILFVYYLASASMIGFALYSITCPNPFFRLITVTLLCAEGFLVLLYLNHLCKTSWISLERINSGKDRGVALAFLVSVLLLPGLLTFAPLFTKNLESFAAVLALSNGAGLVFERILFFRLEQPAFFLSRSQNPEPNLIKSLSYRRAIR